MVVVAHWCTASKIKWFSRESVRIRTDGRTDATKYIISLTSLSINIQIYAFYNPAIRLWGITSEIRWFKIWLVLKSLSLYIRVVIWNSQTHSHHDLQRFPDLLRSLYFYCYKLNDTHQGHGIDHFGIKCEWTRNISSQVDMGQKWEA